MRIVVVTPAAPHPFGDTAAKWLCALIRTFLAGGHQVSCITVSEERTELLREAEARLGQFAKSNQFRFRALRMTTSVSPLTRKLRSLYRPFSELLYSNGFREALDAELRRGYDILHLEQLWTGWVGFGRPRSLLNVHQFEVIDWEGRRLQDFYERKALWQMGRATEEILRHTPHVKVLTSRLLEKARSINPHARYWVVPFALDMSLYSLQPMSAEPVVGLLGSMHWIPSRSAGERLMTRLWPLIKQRVPRAKLYVAGWNARKFLGHHLPLPDVSLEENLAHPSQFFSRVAVMAYAPSRGSGMKIKVLESMAYGVPVVTTWEGVEGMDYENGVHCWVEESDKAIAEKVCRLLENFHERQVMRQAARALMEERHSPAVVVDRMLQVYDDIGATP